MHHRRFRTVLALTIVSALAFASVALAGARTPLTGGTTTLATSTALQSAGVTATPVAPATATSTSFTFPITGGRLNLANGHGTVRDGGGLTLAGSGETVRLTAPIVRSRGDKLVLYAERDVQRYSMCGVSLRRRLRRRCIVLRSYRLMRVGVATGVTDSAGTLTGTLDATKATAKLLDKLAGGTVFATGTALGTITVSPTP